MIIEYGRIWNEKRHTIGHKKKKIVIYIQNYQTFSQIRSLLYTLWTYVNLL